MAQQTTPQPLRQRVPLFGRILDSGRAVHWLISLLVLLVYFPLFALSFSYFGSSAVSTVMLAGLAWSVLLGPGWAFIGILVVTIPDYLIMLGINPAAIAGQEAGIYIAHLGNGVMAYIIGYGFKFRRLLSRELAERKAKEATFRGLFEGTNDAVLISGLDERMTILDVNREAEKLLGYDRLELIGRGYRSLVAPDEQADLDQKRALSARGEWMPFYERTYIRKNGDPITVEINGAQIKDDDGRPLHYQTIARDISERKAAQEQLYYKATHDDLTGVYSRAMFIELIKRGIARAIRNQDKMAVLFIDLDGFKKVNDTHGHATGDILLKAVTQRLHDLLRRTDALGRMGGDEFAVILEVLQNREYADEVAVRIEEELSKPFPIEGKDITIGASVGISIFPDDQKDPEALLSNSDNLMYQAKKTKYAKKLGWPLTF